MFSLFCSCSICAYSLEQATILYDLDATKNLDDGSRRPSARIQCRLLFDHRSCPTSDQLEKKRRNIVISDMDTTNTCDRPMVKFFWNLCCEWTCAAHILPKIQVRLPLSLTSFTSSSSGCSSIFRSRCICGFIHHHLYHVEHDFYGDGSTGSK